MKYMGSKNRYAKYIVPIIIKDRKPNQWYVEPFVGGGNIIDKIVGNRIGNDSNGYLIALLAAIADGWIPPTYVDEQTYKDVRDNKDKYSDHFVGFVGLACSYGAKWFGGFARNIAQEKQNATELNMTIRNYCDESKRNLLKQAPSLVGIKFTSLDYTDMYIPEESIIYCDPPYANATKYKGQVFDHKLFWNWCEKKVSEGHTVFVSEYDAPDRWTCVWEKEVNSSLTKDTGGKKAIEKLFTREKHYENS